MRRFIIKYPDYEYKSYYNTYEIALEKNPSAISVIEIDDEKDYIEHIDLIKNHTTFICDKTLPNGNKLELYRIDETETDIILWLDTNDNKYYDYLEYVIKAGKLMTPILRTISNPKDFCDKVLTTKEIEYSVDYTDKKPKELKGIKAKSVEYIPKHCTNQFFVLNDDLYIKSNDYFSPIYCKPEDVGTPSSYRCKKYGIKPKSEKFIYADNWGSIVLRRKAWLKFSNIVKFAKNHDKQFVVNKMCKLIAQKHKFSDDLDYYWRNMFEKIVDNIKSL